MPPKKAKVATKTAAPEPPATVTTNRGKEIETTAATARPRRATAAAAPALAPASSAKSSAVNAKNKAAPQTQSTPKKRSRSAKTVEEPAEPPKKRGRKAAAKDDEADDVADEVDPEPAEEPVEPPKKRGRAAKAKTEELTEDAELPKQRGRKGRDASPAPAEPTEKTTASKKRARPAKSATEGPAVPNQEQGSPRKRGRPPKGGETTKVDGDDEAAAEQLEGELVTSAQEGAHEDDLMGAEATSGGKQYWLMKAEQEDREEEAADGSMVNTKFTIDDLRAKTEPEMWDGVRNVTAAKNMRAMKLEDLAFFYASGGKRGRVPSIVGIMEIVKEAQPDATASDKSSNYFVKNEKDRGKWCAVGVEFRQKIDPPVALKELQKYTEGKGVLRDMQLMKQSRLSVSKVTDKEWNFIIDNMVEGYDEAAGSATGTGTTEGMKNDEPKVAATDDIDHVMPDVALSNGAATSVPDLALPTVESDPVTTISTIPAETISTSQTASRASRQGSRAPSGAGASRPASRAPSARQASRAPSAVPSANGTIGGKVRGNSLAPPGGSRASSRGRSRTPKPRAGSVQPQMSVVTEEEGTQEDVAE